MKIDDYKVKVGHNLFITSASSVCFAGVQPLHSVFDFAWHKTSRNKHKKHPYSLHLHINMKLWSLSLSFHFQLVTDSIKLRWNVENKMHAVHSNQVNEMKSCGRFSLRIIRQIRESKRLEREKKKLCFLILNNNFRWNDTRGKKAKKNAIYWLFCAQIRDLKFETKS